MTTLQCFFFLGGAPGNIANGHGPMGNGVLANGHAGGGGVGGPQMTNTTANMENRDLYDG